MQSILQKYHVEVIHGNFGEKIDIQIEIDVGLANKFIDSVKEVSAGSAHIIMEE